MEAQGAINLYVCDKCHTAFATVNQEAGVTPMFARCVACECALAQSLMYGIVRLLASKRIARITVSHEFYRPTKDEWNKLSEEQQEHVRRGGLLGPRKLSDMGVTVNTGHAELQAVLRARYDR